LAFWLVCDGWFFLLVISALRLWQAKTCPIIDIIVLGKILSKLLTQWSIPIVLYINWYSLEP
jgi:hypothetical protein